MVAVVLPVWMLVAACGSTNTPATGMDPKQEAAFAYARCMRQHGMPDFPDPKPASNGGLSLGDLSNAPGYVSANTACVHLLPGGATAQRSRQATLRTHALAFARCMRDHGITGFPDPEAAGQFPETQMHGLGKGSAAFSAAQKACQRDLSAD